jgi:hypothetical protein
MVLGIFVLIILAIMFYFNSYRLAKYTFSQVSANTIKETGIRSWVPCEQVYPAPGAFCLP